MPLTPRRAGGLEVNANCPVVPLTIVPPAIVDCAIVAVPSTVDVRPNVPVTWYAVAFRFVVMRGALSCRGKLARLMCDARPARSILVGCPVGPGMTIAPLAVALPP